LAYKYFPIDNRVSLIQETGVANFMRCNIWHVKGRDRDLVIDTGMGLGSLKHWILQHTNRPITAIVTHCHFDHAGCLHEFDERLAHPEEAHILANPDNPSTVYEGAWTRIAIVDLKQHPHYSSETYHITPAPLSGYLDEGDVVDLGDKTYQVLHLPGHSPGSIGLLDTQEKTLFSGDALYDGELLDNLYHSDVNRYQQTLDRIESIDIDVFHAGHYPSFGRAKMREIIKRYRQGTNSLGDVEAWFRHQAKHQDEMFADQDWSEFRALAMPGI